MMYRVAIAALAVLFFAFGVTRLPVSAKTTMATDHGGTYFGETVYVAPDQVVQGDITVFGGDAVIEGEVDGDVTVYGGSIEQHPGSTITGQTHDVGGSWASAVPWASGASNAAAQAGKITLLLAYSVLVILVFLIFPVRVRSALDRLEHHPGLSAAIGTVALIASVPILVLLIISFIGWPLIPIEFVAYVALVLIGQGALGLLLGRRLYELIHPRTTPAPLAALIIGLVVLSAAEILPGVGWLVVGLVWLVGLGASILSFIREAPLMSGPTGATTSPIGGPPMPA